MKKITILYIFIHFWCFLRSQEHDSLRFSMDSMGRMIITPSGLYKSDSTVQVQISKINNRPQWLIDYVSFSELYEKPTSFLTQEKTMEFTKYFNVNGNLREIIAFLYRKDVYLIKSNKIIKEDKFYQIALDTEDSLSVKFIENKICRKLKIKIEDKVDSIETWVLRKNDNFEENKTIKVKSTDAFLWQSELNISTLANGLEQKFKKRIKYEGKDFRQYEMNIPQTAISDFDNFKKFAKKELGIDLVKEMRSERIKYIEFY